MSSSFRTGLTGVLVIAALAGPAAAEVPAPPPEGPVEHAGHAGHPVDTGHTGHGAHAGHAGHPDHAASTQHAVAVVPPASDSMHTGHEGHGRAHEGHGTAHDGHGAHGPAGHNHAEHHALLSGHEHGGGTSYAVSLALIAATYDARLFAGDYQGVVPGVRLARGRFGIAASLPAYRLQKNGRTVGGVGDLMIHGHASLISRGAAMAGVMAMVSAPTGNDEQGLGMGHPMGMAEAWVAWVPGRFALTGSMGYGRASGGASAHAEHGGGMWPLVDPMNASELLYGGTAMVALAPTLAAGVRVAGAAPIGDGFTRLVSGVRVVWGEGRVQTSADLQGGLVGEPFGVRGILETSVRFE